MAWGGLEEATVHQIDGILVGQAYVQTRSRVGALKTVGNRQSKP